MPVRAQQETSSGHAEGHGLTTEEQLYGHRPAGSNQLTAIPHPKFPQTTTGPGHARDGFDTGRSLVATRLNQLQEEQSWLSQHVSASEQLSRNHPAVKKQIRPQVPGHAQDGFDTGRSFVATRLNQLQEKQSWLSQHVSASERLSRNHPTAKKQIRPQAPGHAQDGFDTGRSFVAARLNQLREGNVAGRLNRLRENC